MRSVAKRHRHLLGPVPVAERHIALVFIYIYMFLARVLGADLLELRMASCHGLPLF